MALKLLNPGLRPLGQFDLHDPVALRGGEYVELQTFDPEPMPNLAGGGEGYAADVGQMLSRVVGQGNHSLAFNTATRTRGAAVLGGLADEGINEYGTLFGQVVGSTAGRGTVFLGAGVGGAAVTAGPATSIASGKVTVFDKEGLYGISGLGSGAQLTADAPVPNDLIFSNGGILTDTDPLDGQGIDPVANATGRVGIYVSELSDTSLVSTTSRAVGDVATVECHAIYYLGNAAA